MGADATKITCSQRDAFELMLDITRLGLTHGPLSELNRILLMMFRESI
jgi:hypothetical protein